MIAVQSRHVQERMRHIEGSALVDFAALYEESVELVSVALPLSAAVTAAASQLLSHSGLQAQWVQDSSANELRTDGRPASVNEALRVLREDISTPVEVLQELLGCESCGVRVKVLEGPMCPRFHVDKVPCRMLMTYLGEGTEWIAHDDCDFTAMGSDTPPLLQHCAIKQLKPGTWSLLKGGQWFEGYGGVVHRSPSCKERRLLVSIDPIFSD